MAFNFDKFESEFKQKRLFQSVAQLFGALRDPADQNARLLGVEPNDPLTQFMEQLRIGTDEPIAEFDFELGDPVTIEAAGRLCRDRRVNEMANYLLRTETNRDKTAYRRKELHELVRKPDMELRAPLTTARRLIDVIYPADRAGTETQRSTVWRTAIISFLPDEIAIPLSDRLKVANEICQPITDDELEAMAYQAEEVYRKPPPFPLKFGRNIGSIPVSALIQFNSIDQELENRTAPNYGLPVVTGFGRQYQAYQPLPAHPPRQQIVEPIAQTPARQQQNIQNPPILSPIQTLIRERAIERAKRNLGGTEEAARPEETTAAELPLEQRPLTRNLDDIVPYGDIEEKKLAINDRVFNRNGVPYVEKAGLFFRVILSEPETERPASEIGTRSKEPAGKPD